MPDIDEVRKDNGTFQMGSDIEDGEAVEEYHNSEGQTALHYSQEAPTNIIFKQLHALRVTQMKQGVDLSSLTRTQWGLSSLKFSHHIVLKKSKYKDVPIIFQVTVCASCSPSEEYSPVFLGVYGDQESALLINDVHEILNGSFLTIFCMQLQYATLSSSTSISGVIAVTDLIF
jgi:hypothetical protein